MSHRQNRECRTELQDIVGDRGSYYLQRWDARAEDDHRDVDKVPAEYRKVRHRLNERRQCKHSSKAVPFRT